MNKISHLPEYSFIRIPEVVRTVSNRLNLTGKDLLNYIQTNNADEFVRIQEKILEEQVLSFDREKGVQNQETTEEVFPSELFQSLIKQCRDGLIFIIQPKEELIVQNDYMRIVPNYQEQIDSLVLTSSFTVRSYR